MYIPYQLGDPKVYSAWTLGGVTGSIAATLAAASPLFALRWAPPSGTATYLMIHRISVGIAVNATVTTAVPFDLKAVHHRAFTANFSGGTPTDITPGSGGNVVFSNGNYIKVPSMNGQANSILIAGTAAMTTVTSTADGQPFAVTPLVAQPQTTAGGTSGGMVPLFEANQISKHPIVYQTNEGFVISNILAGPATGTFRLYVEVEATELTSYP